MSENSVTCTRCRAGRLRPHLLASRLVRCEQGWVDVPGVPAERCDNPACGEITVLPEGLEYAKDTAKRLQSSPPVRADTASTSVGVQITAGNRESFEVAYSSISPRVE